jgi:hypothetical protein
MGYGNGMSGGKQLAYRPAKRKVKFKKEFSTFETNYAATSGAARIIFTGSGGVVSGTIVYKRGYPFCIFTATDSSVTNKRFALRAITSDSVSRGAHLVTFNQS